MYITYILLTPVWFENLIPHEETDVSHFWKSSFCVQVLKLSWTAYSSDLRHLLPWYNVTCLFLLSTVLSRVMDSSEKLSTVIPEQQTICSTRYSVWVRDKGYGIDMETALKLLLGW